MIRYLYLTVLVRLLPIREPLPREVVFDHLQNRRRRLVLTCFDRLDSDEVTLRELVDQVTAWETGVSPDDIESNDRLAVYASLHQTHLPKLDEGGFLEYDRDDKTVRITDRGRRLQLYLEYSPEWGIPWSRLFLGLSVLWFLVVAAAWGGLPPIDRIPDRWIALGVTVTFFVASILYAWSAHARGKARSRRNRSSE